MLPIRSTPSRQEVALDFCLLLPRSFMSFRAQSLDFGQGLIIPGLVSRFDEGLDLLDALGGLRGFVGLWERHLPGLRSRLLFFNE